ncbi:MAG: hypothetical protein E3K36_15415 [Candidatus Brocadia sp.]|nr:hypothetical protein [Candidatus Brocadia sp.]
MLETPRVAMSNKHLDFNIQLGAYSSEDVSPFEKVIYDELKKQELRKGFSYDTVTTRIEGGILSQLERNTFEARAVYSDSKKGTSSVIKEQLKKYKEDQLLSNPGGDYFNLAKDVDVIDYSNDQSKFNVRVGKDLKDAGENFLNILKDMGLGAPFKYVDEEGYIQEGKKVGFAGAVVNFLKDIASGITLGKYTHGDENIPGNALEATKHFFKKIFVDAIFKDMVVGIPRSAIHVGENAIFICMNLAEVVPDATIGNFKKGQVVTTEIFDDIQVFVDFVTDVIPMGEAGSRIRAFTFKKGIRGFPVVNNITSPEQGIKDENWRYVRNTPLRKTIESITTLVPVRM